MQFLSGQNEIIESINNFGKSFKTTALAWQFELPDLYQFCRQTAPELAELEYQQFRQMLYQNPTNQILFSSGGRFELVENRGHIDRNCYALVVTN
jgi:hypothetical protein